MKTIQIQRTIRPNPAKPTFYEGRLSRYWYLSGPTAVLASVFGIHHDEDDEPMLVRRSPVIVELEGCGGTLVTVRDAETGLVLEDRVLWVDSETDILIRGVTCDVVESCRAVREVRDDLPMPAEREATGQQQEASHV